MATQRKPTVFDNLRVKKEDIYNSIQWFQSQIKVLKRSTYQPKHLLTSQAHLVVNPTPGKMYMYIYDAKWKDELPYWDAVPVIFFLRRIDAEHFNGINLHYLPPNLRLKVLHALFDITNNDRLDATTRLKATWDIIYRLSQAKNLGIEHCIKTYLYGQMQSKFLEINSPSWIHVALLPIEDFQKRTKQYVWHQTRSRM